MGTNRDWDMALEESAQGVDSFTAPGSAAHLDDAREASREWAAGGTIESGATERVETARIRRHNLGDALSQLEHALTSPMASSTWLGEVTYALAEMRRSLEEHIEVTEGRGGLLEEIRGDAPRLAGEIELIVAEHDELMSALEAAEGCLGQSNDRKAIRSRAMAILPRLSLHRQRGADLVYEAYNVDIAAGD